MGMTQEGGYSLERSIIRIGGAFALLIAEVILVAVVVSIAIAAGGYFFGLFGTQTSMAIVSITTSSMVVEAPIADCDNDTTLGESDILSLEFQNAGNLDDSISSLRVPGSTEITLFSADAEIQPNTASVIILYCVDGQFTEGQTISFVLKLASGVIIPVTVTHT